MVGLHLHGPAPGLLFGRRDRIREAMHAEGAEHGGRGQGQGTDDNKRPIDFRHWHNLRSVQRLRLILQPNIPLH